MDKTFNEITIFIFITTFVIVLLALLLVNLLLSSRNKRLQHRSQIFEMKASLETELAATKIEVAENTLNDVARDLHDDVGQLLTFSIIQLNNAQHNTSGKSETMINEVRDTLQDALQSIRNISKALSHDYIRSFGIYNAVQQLFAGLNRKRIIQTQLDFPDSIKFKTASNEIFAFRIIQECISNTIKHANASLLSLKVEETDQHIIITYDDNGKGLGDNEINNDFKKFSMGFNTMLKRAELMNGKIDFLPSESNGLRVLLSFPNL